MNLSNLKSNGTYHHVVFVDEQTWEDIHAENLRADLVLPEHDVNVGDSVSFFKMDADGEFTGDTTKAFYIKYAGYNRLSQFLNKKYKMITW